MNPLTAPLTAGEYRAVLTRLELTHQKAAVLFGVSVRMSKTYGQEGVPEGLSSMAIRLFMRDIDGGKREASSAPWFLTPTLIPVVFAQLLDQLKSADDENERLRSKTKVMRQALIEIDLLVLGHPELIPQTVADALKEKS